MKQHSATDRIIFGLKAKQLRLASQQSFADLATATGMSLSYLNEIEKGKKFPKQDKIDALAKALNTSPEWLTDGHLDRHLAPVESLLRSNFLNELPLDLFGIELNKVVEIVASAPVRVAAFISTLLELSRSYNLREENFYFGALRAYLELHENFFPELEKAVVQFSKEYELTEKRPLSPTRLADILTGKYDYNIKVNGLRDQPSLNGLRALYLPNSKSLLLQEGLLSHQATFQYGKELAFNYLKLGERASTSSLLNARSFEEVINHSKAIYFSAALHLPLDDFSNSVRRFFAADRWQSGFFEEIMERYRVNPETVYHRLTNVIPHLFNFSRLFFLRFAHGTESNRFSIDRELHLDRRNHPRANARNEHYCRRWLSVRMLKDLDNEDILAEDLSRDSSHPGKLVVKAQRSRYHGTEDTYLCLSLARKDHPVPGRNVSLTLGLLINDDLRAFCNWVDDPAISSREVNVTCERCPIENCAVRAAEPVVIQKRARLQEIQEVIEGLDSGE
ncbi:DNA-binding protein [Lewinellaceae bacterium SD302]|nr:DNA-binding protein [Lewinellaceae bacterium SD302]